MNILLWIGAAAAGYLLGSISTARLFGRIFAPDVDFSRHDFVVEGTGVISFDVTSATNISQKLGPRYGCSVAILDMQKVFLPTLFFRLAFPAFPCYLATAAFGVVGHNFPLYHGFRGGAGLAPALGGLLVVDWLAVPVTPVAGMILGFAVVRDAYAASVLWIFLLIPWFWIRTRSCAHVAYAVVLSVSFVVSMIPMTKQYFKIRKMGQEAIIGFYEQNPMGRGLVKIGRLFGLYKKKI